MSQPRDPRELHPASLGARARVVLGVVGGSGLYELPGLTKTRRVELSTPFGAPSDAYVVGELAREHAPPLMLVFLPRHGRGHRLNPSEIDYRANVHGLKQLGVTHMLSVSAVGSLREEIAPGHFATPDQFIDRTRQRAASFFERGVVAHVQFGDPTDDRLRARVAEAVAAEGGTVHRRATCVVMEGPAFSTRAESELYRRWGADVIGMTALPEAKLAREAEIAYAMLAMSTDYDCWHESGEQVSVDAVMAVMRANVELARRVVHRVARALPERCVDLPWPEACRHAIVTPPAAIDAQARERLDLIIGHYLPPPPLGPGPGEPAHHAG